MQPWGKGLPSLGLSLLMYKEGIVKLSPSWVGCAWHRVGAIAPGLIPVGDVEFASH